MMTVNFNVKFVSVHTSYVTILGLGTIGNSIDYIPLQLLSLHFIHIAGYYHKIIVSY